MSKPGQLTAVISSTVLDLPEHRKQVFDACLEAGVFPIGMEHLPARDVTGVRASLDMVDQADIYIGIYAWRYGWIPPFDNPGKISITEMEFNRALERKASHDLKEVLIFLIQDAPPPLPEDKENDADAQQKLKQFKERASAGRVCGSFKSIEDLHGKVFHSVSEAKQRIGEPPPPDRPIPKPPVFYAEPDYIGSHPFIGRQAQLKVLSDWAMSTDRTSVLLFEAIGGNGKSMLTWEWTNNHATKVRADWAGRFWYSFYERGAVMADFCQRALAYMTGQPLEELKKKKTAELKDSLLAQLHAKPWLLILDGLERVLVAYHRIDAAEMADEEANRPTDKIVNRNPCDSIRDEDNDLLRALAVAAPSKILVSSRLTPRVLLNASGLPIPGVRPITLPGLDEPDAEGLLRLCGITGNSTEIRNYLKTNCDNHPLVIGVLAGLINNYLPDRGNFDAWSVDPDGGVQLNLASLDLIQRRNNILHAALSALPKESAQLLSTLALLSESVDYETLKAFNPHLPPEPEKVEKPESPEQYWRWERMTDEEKAERRKHYETAFTRWEDYEKAVKARRESPEYIAAPKKLQITVTDLEHRGLLQYDRRTRRHDLHPVVRGVAAGGMKPEDKERYGQRAVDHFSSQPHNPYEDAKTIEDVRNGIHVVRILLQMGHLEQAFRAYDNDLASALLFNLEANSEIVSLLRPFFPSGWTVLPESLSGSNAAIVANHSGIALQRMGECEDAFKAHCAALMHVLNHSDWSNVEQGLFAISETLASQNKLAEQERCLLIAINLADTIGSKESLFLARLNRMFQLSLRGLWNDAEAMWHLVDPMERSTTRIHYLPGEAECRFAQLQFWRGEASEEALGKAEHLADDGKSRSIIRTLHHVRGTWWLEHGDWAPAVTSFAEALRLARESGIPDTDSEAGLALAKYHLGQLSEPQREAERLAQLRKPAHRLLAHLWLALGDPAHAKQHALAAYKWAWADGEPYVNRYELTKTTELLQLMNVPIPNLPPYDRAKDKRFPWEDAVAAAIEKLKAEKEAKKTKEK